MTRNRSVKLGSMTPLVAIGMILLFLLLLFVQVRKNSAEVSAARQAMSAQSIAAEALRRENRELRGLTNPKVILIIGDGMDDQQITIARNYLVGSRGKLSIDAMPYRGTIQVQAVSERKPELAVYISDSANTATAMATGVVTSPRRIGTTAGTDQDIRTIMELAIAANIGTGIVTTANVTDATPASFIAHVNDRRCQVPVDMVKSGSKIPYDDRDCSADFKRNGGPGSIAEQIAASQVSILIGGGSGLFEHASEQDPDTSIAELAQHNGYDVVSKLTRLGNLETDQKALVLLSPYDMPVRLRGVDDASARRIIWEDSIPILPAAFSCEKNRRARNLPTLAEMTQAAIDHLDKHGRFMLMVESASIDKEAHRRRPCGHIGEVRQLDEAVRVALDYAATRPEVLLLVTADHGTAAHIIPETSRWAPQNHSSPGHFARVLTPEGAIMGINYASNDARQEEHSGVQVPVYASGFGVDRLPAFMRQAEIFEVTARHMGLRK